jgi:hypothetical protein
VTVLPDLPVRDHGAQTFDPPFCSVTKEAAAIDGELLARLRDPRHRSYLLQGVIGGKALDNIFLDLIAHIDYLETQRF